MLFGFLCSSSMLPARLIHTHCYDADFLIAVLQQRLPLPSESQALNQRQVMVVPSIVPTPSWTAVDRPFIQNRSIGVGIFRLVVVKGIQITLDHTLFILPLLCPAHLYFCSLRWSSGP
jgi:hypothetical protein